MSLLSKYFSQDHPSLLTACGFHSNLLFVLKHLTDNNTYATITTTKTTIITAHATPFYWFSKILMLYLTINITFFTNLKLTTTKIAIQ
jgi:hypothetical protein